MMFKKRGFFLGRKAQAATHESAQILLWALFLALFAFVLFGYVNTIKSGTVFEKNYIARDLAMVVNTVYASPQDLVYVYPTNTSLFYVKIKDHKVRVTDFGMEPESVDKIYWYGDENQSMLNIEEPFERVDNLKFIKTESDDGVNINIVKTVLDKSIVFEIPSSEPECKQDGSPCNDDSECCSGSCVESQVIGTSHCGPTTEE